MRRNTKNTQLPYTIVRVPIMQQSKKNGRNKSQNDRMWQRVSASRNSF